MSVAPAADIQEIEEPEALPGPPPTPMIITTSFTKQQPFAPAVVPMKGVDLNLNQFDLSTPSQAEAMSVAGSWGCEAAGKDFWSRLEDASALDKEDACLLQEIFNPNLSDRREDGDRFAPPGTAFDYVEKLRNLVKAEEQVRNQRKEHFLSTKFAIGDAGPLFPSSWTTSLEIARARVPRKTFGSEIPEGASLQQVPHSPETDQILQSTMPVFEQQTEDGMKFRIYRSGTLEVRTTQEHGKVELLGAVFSVRHATDSSKDSRKVHECEKIVKATEYVRFLPQSGASREYGYYVVMESEEDNAVVTERLDDGTMTWEENPADLDDRNSLAKVIRSVDCRIERMRVAFKEVKSFQKAQGTCVLENRRYAQQVFIQAIGGVTQMIRANNIKAKTLDQERDSA
jgi:hypothetical protein